VGRGLGKGEGGDGEGRWGEGKRGEETEETEDGGKSGVEKRKEWEERDGGIED